MAKVKVAWFDFTCCEGCQIEMTNFGEPFVQLRAPYIFNLRSDPLERAHHEGIGYERWWADHFFMVGPAQFIAKKFMDTFAEFPPRQKPGSFSIEKADAMLTEATTSGR